MIYVAEGRSGERGRGKGGTAQGNVDKSTQCTLARHPRTLQPHPPTYTMQPVGVVHGGCWGWCGEQVLVGWIVHGKLDRHKHTTRGGMAPPLFSNMNMKGRA
jgi:hypothetical protein